MVVVVVVVVVVDIILLFFTIFYNHICTWPLPTYLCIKGRFPMGRELASFTSVLDLHLLQKRAPHSKWHGNFLLA